MRVHPEAPARDRRFDIVLGIVAVVLAGAIAMVLVNRTAEPGTPSGPTAPATSGGSTTVAPSTTEPGSTATPPGPPNELTGSWAVRDQDDTAVGTAVFDPIRLSSLDLQLGDSRVELVEPARYTCCPSDEVSVAIEVRAFVDDGERLRRIRFVGLLGSAPGAFELAIPAGVPGLTTDDGGLTLLLTPIG